MTMLRAIPLVLAALLLAGAPARAQDDTFSQEEILAKARGFFGETTKGLAKAIEKVFAESGSAQRLHHRRGGERRHRHRPALR